MPTSVARTGRGRPRSASRQQYAAAILAIKGREPTIDELCAALGVSKATFYNHIPGYDALVLFAGDVICATIALPSASPGMHWSQWCVDLARVLSATFDDYPILLRQLSPRGGQMGLLEGALERLTTLGLDTSMAMYAFFAVTNVMTAAANNRQLGDIASGYPDVEPALREAQVNAPVDTPLIHELLEQGYDFSGNFVFDDILLYTLEGIARRRDEQLPALDMGDARPLP